ncbi:hypothetical protein ACA910_002740 [Epithemia clementina (nom. ined.)]
MTASNNGSARNGKGGKSYATTDSLREACPPHKLNELDNLVKELKGDEERILQKIAEWWDQGEGAPATEEQWEDVNKKHGKKKDMTTTSYRGRGRGGSGEGRGREGRGEGRGREGRGRGSFRGGDGGRGGGRGRSPGGRGGRGRSQPRDKGGHGSSSNGGSIDENNLLNDLDSHPPPPGGIPANVKIPQGAWAKQQTTSTTNTTSAAATNTTGSDYADEVMTEPPVSSMVESHEPDLISAPVSSQHLAGAKKSVARSGPTTGNVWATKGSAHLIQAEKPKLPAPVHAAVTAPIKRSTPTLAPVGNLSAPTPMTAPPMHVPPEPEPELEPEPPIAVLQHQHDVIPPSNSAQVPSVSTSVNTPLEVVDDPSPVARVQNLEDSVWGAASSPPVSVPTQPTKEEHAPEPPVTASSIHTQPIGAPVVEPQAPPAVSHAAPQTQAPRSVQPKSQPRAPPPSVLNMGHWETDGDDKNIDFGFGTFGVDPEAAIMDATTASSSTNNVSQAAPKESPAPATAPSPARPPPGLSIGGAMRPIPADAVLVHELENKLEEASLNAAAQQAVTEPSSGGLQSQQSQSVAPPDGNSVSNDSVAPANNEPSAPNHQVPTYGQPVATSVTGGMGMYNYGGNPAGASAAFIGGMPSAPALGTPIPPKPPMGVALAPTQPQSLYGGAPTAQQQAQISATSSGTGPNNANAPNSSNNTPTPTPGLPPGMPAIPYNPALFYGQQPHMGQYQGQIGYNYGYGAQFGGVQGGFGYPPSMGHSGGYGGGPHYDDQGGSHQGTSGYQKNTGGYRGRGNHHNNANQYQNQYNPQQHAGAYGGQPYGAMGYHGGDFSRGGYGQPGGMQDHYIPQQQQPQAPQIGGFQSDADQYKGKKGGPRGGYQQFQPGPPPHLNQQPFGLQGSQAGGSNSDSNSHSGPGTTGGTTGAGGWANQTSGGGGWGAGAPSWQGK